MDGRTVLVTGAAVRHRPRRGPRLRRTRRDGARRRPQRAIGPRTRERRCWRRSPAPRSARWPATSAAWPPSASCRSGCTQEFDRLDVLVNNAGVMPEERTRSADGYELMFATHVLAPFALTKLLADLLSAARPGRVINVSSGGMYHQSIPAGDLQSDGASYGPKKFYARTKREQVVISEAVGRAAAPATMSSSTRCTPDGSTPRACASGCRCSEPSPGRSSAIPIRARTRSCGWVPHRSRRAARAASGRTGGGGRRITRIGASPDSDAARRELWDFCEAAVGS